MPPRTTRKSERPILWIIAGPNGSGKSSFYNQTDIAEWGGSVWIINPDLLTQTIVEQEALPLMEANLKAVQRIEGWLNASLDVYQTIGVETVLSSSKYRPLVERAHRRGFRVRMLFMVLGSADAQLDRIRTRVEEGGHDVPADKVRSRRIRSFEQLAWFLPKVDQCYIYDNSTGAPELAAEKVDGKLLIWSELPADLHETLKKSGVEILFIEPS